MMGFLSLWLQRKGSTGSIARWAFNAFIKVKASNLSVDEAEICQQLFNIRYSAVPPKPKEFNRFRDIIVEDIENLENLCLAIVWIEMGVDLRDGKLFKDVKKVIQCELKRLGYTY